MQVVRKTYKEKLRPTPEQERQLDVVLWRCRTLYNVALEQRKTAWEWRHVSVKRYAQELELADIRHDYPEYAAIHSHVLQDVLARLDKTYQAFFRRLLAGEKPGYPRFQGRSRYHSFTYKEYGNGARLDNGYLVLSKIGRIAVHWSRPVEGTPKTVTVSKEADGWYVVFLLCRHTRAPTATRQARRQVSILGWRRSLIAGGWRHALRITATTAKPSRNCRRPSGGYPAARRAASVAVKQCSGWPRSTRRSSGSGETSTIKRRSTWCSNTTSIYHEDLRVSQHGQEPPPGQEHQRCRLERTSVPSLPSRQHAGRSGSGRCRSRLYLTSLFRLRCAGCQKGSRCGGTMCALNAGPACDRDENAARNIQWRGQRLRGLAAVAAGANREPVAL